ncbi:hypothetical protein CMMCAS07_16945 [Clavibacter michiganensis subsp. michiganensis]|uniref:Uncharacterized protein n=1 Tax=Clavibacter michiganensis subsp. michiganensis TaxID=33013 RepID=A0A251XEU2_CLAMM|nr:hypothetical protein CMMCAS07_16945 [Clavibacter michiganensis subsp. michiganensis]
MSERVATTTSPMRAATSSRTGPYQSAAIASERVATWARVPSDARHASARASASVPGSRCRCRQRGSPATCRTPATSSGTRSNSTWDPAGTSTMPWSAVMSAPSREPRRSRNGPAAWSSSSRRRSQRSDSQPCEWAAWSSSGT